MHCTVSSFFTVTTWFISSQQIHSLAVGMTTHFPQVHLLKFKDFVQVGRGEASAFPTSIKKYRFSILFNGEKNSWKMFHIFRNRSHLSLSRY